MTDPQHSPEQRPATRRTSPGLVVSAAWVALVFSVVANLIISVTGAVIWVHLVLGVVTATSIFVILAPVVRRLR